LPANDQLLRTGGKDTLIVLGGIRRDEWSAFLIGFIKDPRLLPYDVQQGEVVNIKNPFVLGSFGV
jgi:hypothetical protein